ncbi:MAG TPA: hypothetical protein VLA89_08090 [Gemmatimonadales bacterium]|nr:hypothetical protein [Gemmatimonadales bacterium]
MAAPAVRGTGAVGAGTTSATAAAPTGGSAPQSGDAIFIFVESSDSSTAVGTPNTPANYTKLLETSILSGSTGVSTGTIFGKIAGASEGDVTIDGVGDHTVACMVVIAAPHGLSSISDTVIGSINQVTTANGSGSAPSVAVTADSRVLMVCFTSRDINSTAGFNTWANSNFTGVAELADRSVNTNAGGGLGLGTGACAGTSTGTSTWNMGSAEHQDLHIAIPPEGAATELTPSGLSRSRTIGTGPTVNPSLLPTGLLRGKAIGSPSINTQALPSGLLRSRALGTTEVHPVFTVTMTGLSRTRSIGTGPTTDTQTLPSGLARTKTIGTAPVVNPSLGPSGLVRSRTIGIVYLALAIPGLARTRGGLGDVITNPQVLVTGLARSRGGVGTTEVTDIPPASSRIELPKMGVG